MTGTKIKFNLTQIILLGLVLIMGFGLRFYHLGNWPMAFAADEAALGYNAWSILTTGRDEWGKWLPLTLRSFDDNKPAIYSYMDIPFVAIFGLTEAASRMPAALWGSILALSIFGLVYKVTNNFWQAWLAAVFTAFSPWHIEISRTAIESGVALSIAVLGYVLFSAKSKKWNWLALGLILLSLFTYHSARLVAPMVLVFGLWSGVYKKPKSLQIVVYGLAILGLGLALTGSSARFKQISIFTDRGSELDRLEAIREDGHPLFMTSAQVTHLFHNKPMSWVMSFTDSYLKNTSLSFLFLGGAQPPRVTIPEVGQFQLILLPFFLFGLVALFRRFDAVDKWMIMWLIWSPMPASMTTAELPHTYRTLFMLPPLVIIISRGMLYVLNWIKRHIGLFYKPAIILMVVLYIYNTGKSHHQYLVHQQVHKPWFRQSGYEALISYLNRLNSVNEYHITNAEGEPYIYLLFYNKILPKVYQEQTSKRLAHADIDKGADRWQLFNYHFYQDMCPEPTDPREVNANDIFVVQGNCILPDGYLRLKTIRFADGVPEFNVDQFVGHNPLPGVYLNYPETN